MFFWNYSGMWWRAMFNINFAVPANVSLFASDSILFGWISVISFNCCATLLWMFMQHFLKGIKKSLHWNFDINIDNPKPHFLFLKIFWKTKHEQHISCAHLFGTSITLLQLLTAWKVSKYGVISGPYLDTFHAVTQLSVTFFSSIQRQPLVL